MRLQKTCSPHVRNLESAYGKEACSPKSPYKESMPPLTAKRVEAEVVDTGSESDEFFKAWAVKKHKRKHKVNACVYVPAPTNSRRSDESAVLVALRAEMANMASDDGCIRGLRYTMALYNA